jgi:peptide/nickel transport system permease protein
VEVQFIKGYLVPRLLQYILVTVLGITIVFAIPRLLPGDPVEKMVSTMQSRSANLDPAAAEKMILSLREMYGLDQGVLQQYVTFWRRLSTGDFGPSLFVFPTPVTQLIGQALPWTAALLLITTLLGWAIGNLLGGLAGYYPSSRAFKILDGAVMLIRPIPYYVFALTLLILFAYMFPVFPLGGGYTVGMKLSFTVRSVKDILLHAFLPALSLTVLGVAATFQTMRLIIRGVVEEDYVRYAKIAAVKEGTVFTKYGMRNAILPQITGLTLSLGGIFGGALITEMVFGYPGLGFLLYRAIVNTDYNLLMGITTISIVAITTSILVVDLLYPLFDPRIRYR